MAFFVPRRLERVQSGQLMRFDERLSKRDLTRDSELNARASVEIYSHEALLEHILQRPNEPSNKLWVVLSEPGDGKTRLLLEWAKMQAGQLLRGNPWLVPVPLLAQCGFLQTSSLQRDQNQLPWLLFALSTQPSNPRKLLEELQTEKTKLPALLFIDAIDELPIELVTALAASLENLPFRVVLSCRREDWNARWRDLLPKAREKNTYRLLPLNSSEQQQFLEHWAAKNNRDALWANELHKKLRSQPALVNISETVLLLALIARVYDQDAGSLPGSRDEFYQRALNAMWQRKTAQKRVSEIRIDEQMWLRDWLLTKLALVIFKQGSNRGVFNFADFMQATLESGLTRREALPILERLKDTGIVLRRSNQIEPQYWFAHRTFQEYALMRAWMLDSDHAVTPEELTARLKEKLLEHWQEEELLEPLALSIAFAHRQQAKVYEALDVVIQIGLMAEKLHNEVTISPLRRTLHLLQRAGVELNGTEKDELFGHLNSHGRKIAVATDPKCPSFILEILSRDERWEVRAKVAENLSTPLAILEAFVNEPTEEEAVLYAVARNPNTSLAILDLLSEGSETIRSGVALNTQTPLKTLEKFALNTNDNSRVLWGVALNPNTPATTLIELSRHPNNDVRRAVAINTSTPEENILLLANDAEKSIVRAAARNKSNTLAVLKKFAISDDPNVRGGVAANLNTSNEILELLVEDHDFLVRSDVAWNPNTKTKILQILAENEKDFVVIAAIARNPNISQAIIEILMKNDNRNVLAALAENLNTSATTLEALYHRGVDIVYMYLAENPNTPSSILEKLVQNKSPVSLEKTYARINPSIFLESIPNDNLSEFSISYSIVDSELEQE